MKLHTSRVNFVSTLTTSCPKCFEILICYSDYAWLGSEFVRDWVNIKYGIVNIDIVDGCVICVKPVFVLQLWNDGKWVKHVCQQVLTFYEHGSM